MFISKRKLRKMFQKRLAYERSKYTEAVKRRSDMIIAHDDFGYLRAVTEYNEAFGRALLLDELIKELKL